MGNQPGYGHRVLVFAEDPEILRQITGGLGAQLVTTSSSEDAAVDLAESTRFDVIVCDLDAPRGAGARVYRRLRALGLADRVLPLTGDAMPTSQVRQLGELDHAPLPKSFTAQALQVAVKEVARHQKTPARPFPAPGAGTPRTKSRSET